MAYLLEKALQRRPASARTKAGSTLQQPCRVTCIARSCVGPAPNMSHALAIMAVEQWKYQTSGCCQGRRASNEIYWDGDSDDERLSVLVKSLALCGSSRGAFAISIE